MKKLYREFFYIPKDGKISDKVIITRITSTVVIVVMCLAAMSYTAYAYFSHNIASATNVISAAHFETMVSIKVIDENGQNTISTPITSNYQSHMIEVDAGKRYLISVVPTENCTASTGYIALTADGCDNTYHTWQVWTNENVAEGKLSNLSFELMFTDKTNVYFNANWGTSSHYDALVNAGENNELYITQGEQVKVIVNGITDPPINAVIDDAVEHALPVIEQSLPADEIIE